MVLRNFNGYIYEDLAALKELPMFYSPKFRNILEKLDSNVAKDLLALTKSEQKFSASYADLAADNDLDFLTVLPVNRIPRLEGVTEEDIENPKDNSVLWREKFRQKVRIGAFVTKVLPKYAGSKDLEIFVHQVKGKLDAGNYILRIVKGEELRGWYHVSTYYNPHPGMEEPPEEGVLDVRTPLMRSCLKQPEKQPFFDMYVENPDICGMLIMTNKDNKLIARAIVWFNVFMVDNPQNPTKGVILDRIYYTNESDVNIFIDYFKENGWWYKTNQAKGCETYVVNDVVTNKPLTVKLTKAGHFEKYPYMDTFCYYTPETGRLASSRGKPAKNPKTGEFFEKLLLQKANGGFKRLLPK
jgi:hypothetical protein